jgi:hypothetical protein
MYPANETGGYERPEKIALCVEMGCTLTDKA